MRSLSDAPLQTPRGYRAATNPPAIRNPCEALTVANKQTIDTRGIDYETEHFYTEYLSGHRYIVVRRSDQAIMADYTARNLARSQAIRRANKLEAKQTMGSAPTSSAI
jgi:hypothetical protein